MARDLRLFYLFRLLATSYLWVPISLLWMESRGLSPGATFAAVPPARVQDGVQELIRLHAARCRAEWRIQARWRPSASEVSLVDPPRSHLKEAARYHLPGVGVMTDRWMFCAGRVAKAGASWSCCVSDRKRAIRVRDGG